ncbi:Cytochrome P450 94A2 [Camellia lanceoleosa]|uniref:Cytochrome P450 94A2 n=1 Tax=Camellia lanceoleosa TaxID=1840588 RepID=A0ACC0FRT6_9ERIC|nr:Cytochrome P450 94A2 [Camellia lanceoleosa]
MLDLELSTSFLFCILSLLFLFIINFSKSIFTTFFPSTSTSSKISSKIPRSYPLIGSFLAFYSNRQRVIQWTSDAVTSTPTSTFVLNRPLGRCQVITANPSNVQHILKTHFHIYQKGIIIRTHVSDLLGDDVDGENWKFQRQVASREFNTKSLRKFVETIVDTKLSDRLIPILSSAAANKTVLDLQDILQRFAFDNICKIAFGHDPAYLLPSLLQEKFAVAFNNANK